MTCSSHLRRSRGIVMLTTLALTACALGPDFQGAPPPTQTRLLPDGSVPRALTANGEAQHFDATVPVDTFWWSNFGSATLNSWIGQALHDNPSIQVATATLTVAQHNLQSGYGVFLPQLGAAVSASRQRAAVNLGQGLTGVGPYSLGTASVVVSYAPDLFGAQRRTVEALAAGVDEQSHQLRMAQLSLAGNLATTAMARSAYDEQCHLAETWLGLLDESVELTRRRVAAGTSSGTELATAKNQRTAVQTSLATLRLHRAQADHLLHQLLGKGPADGVLDSLPLDALRLPAALPDVVPAELVHDRPDILLAESQLHQASAHIGIATANLFPTLGISAGLGRDNSLIAQTLHAGTRVWSAQAALTASVFSGGSQWATRQAALAQYDATLAQYESVVLSGFAQTADAVQALASDAEMLDAQTSALAAATLTLHAADAQLAAGVLSRLDWISARSQWIQASLAHTSARAQRLQDTVAFYVAIGGQHLPS
jgi:NodT family efflux transporter outer membrane factor (OMF) lipoprotein